MAARGENGLHLSRLREHISPTTAKADLPGIPSAPIFRGHALTLPFKLCPCGVCAKAQNPGWFTSKWPRALQVSLPHVGQKPETRLWGKQQAHNFLPTGLWLWTLLFSSNLLFQWDEAGSILGKEFQPHERELDTSQQPSSAPLAGKLSVIYSGSD